MLLVRIPVTPFLYVQCIRHKAALNPAIAATFITKEATTIAAIEEATTIIVAAGNETATATIEEAATVDVDVIGAGYNPATATIKQAAIAAIKKSPLAAGNIAAKIAAGNKKGRPVTNLILRILNMRKLLSMNVDAHTRVPGLAD